MTTITAMFVRCDAKVSREYNSKAEVGGSRYSVERVGNVVVVVSSDRLGIYTTALNMLVTKMA